MRGRSARVLGSAALTVSSPLSLLRSVSFSTVCGPIAFGGPPPRPVTCGLSASVATIPRQRMDRGESCFTPLEQTAASATPEGLPEERFFQKLIEGHGRSCSPRSSLGKELRTFFRGVLFEAQAASSSILRYFPQRTTMPWPVPKTCDQLRAPWALQSAEVAIPITATDRHHGRIYL